MFKEIIKFLCNVIVATVEEWSEMLDEEEHKFRFYN